MLKTLLISTLVAVGCVLSSGAAAYKFSDYFKLELIESQDESGAGGSPPSRIFFELSLQAGVSYRHVPNRKISFLLDAGGSIIIELTEQNGQRTQRYNQLIVHILDPPEGSWEWQIQLTRTDGATGAGTPFEYQPHLWINPLDEQESAEPIPDDWYLNRIFIEGVMAYVDSMLQPRDSGSVFPVEWRHSEFSEGDFSSGFIISVDFLSRQSTGSQLLSGVATGCGTGTSGWVIGTAVQYCSSIVAPAESDTSDNEPSKPKSWCERFCPRGSSETVGERVTVVGDQMGGDLGNSESSYDTTGDENSGQDGSHEERGENNEGLENDQGECDDPPEGSAA